MAKKTKDSLGDRMKEYYENRAKTYLTRRTPVIIRLDGKAFHSFTKGFKRPYDEVFHEAMNNTMKYLCANIQGCKLGYTQSDEITLLLTDYTTLTTDAWFGYGVQKMCSVAASMATLMFNRYFRDAINKKFTGTIEDFDYFKTLSIARDKGAMFDARCFNIPKEEVVNCFLWRFLDCYRNSVQMLGQTYFNSKQLYGLSSDQIQEKLFQELQINYAHCPEEFKNGICAMKNADGKWELSPMKDPRKNREFFDSYLASVTE